MFNQPETPKRPVIKPTRSFWFVPLGGDQTAALTGVVVGLQKERRNTCIGRKGRLRKDFFDTVIYMVPKPEDSYVVVMRKIFLTVACNASGK